MRPGRPRRPPADAKSKTERARAVIKEVDQIAAAADVAAQNADGFRERSDLNVHAPVKAEMIDGSAAVAAQHAR
jgi:hypothetical protein